MGKKLYSQNVWNSQGGGGGKKMQYTKFNEARLYKGTIS